MVTGRRKRSKREKQFGIQSRILFLPYLLSVSYSLFGKLVYSFVPVLRIAKERGYSWEALPIEDLVEENLNLKKIELDHNETEPDLRTASSLGEALRALSLQGEAILSDEERVIENGKEKQTQNYDEKQAERTNRERGSNTNKSEEGDLRADILEGLISMDAEIAAELDSSVLSLRGVENLNMNMEITPMPPYDDLKSVSDLNQIERKDLSLPVWSRKSHYEEQIDDDKRRLSTAICGFVKEPWQWKQFRAEKGGIRYLLKSISRGAAAVSERKKKDISQNEQQKRNDSYLEACYACRAMRDLCAISDEFRAIITDDILRANTASSGRLMEDICSLLKHANDEKEPSFKRPTIRSRIQGRRNRRESRNRCRLIILQLLLTMAIASDDAIDTFRAIDGLKEAVVTMSSYGLKQKTGRWLRYPWELLKNSKLGRMNQKRKKVVPKQKRRPFIEAAQIRDGLYGQVQGTANQLLAAIGYNQWVPKIVGQRGLRILCFDGGGTRGMSAVASLCELTEYMEGKEVCDAFDIICGTSTGAIIAFLVGLRRESSQQANDRYNVLIERIFGKSLRKLSFLLQTAKYSEQPILEVLKEILGNKIMLDSRADPTVPLVFAVSSVLTSNPTYATLCRNYNYAGGGLPDNFVLDPNEARKNLGIEPEFQQEGGKTEWRKSFDRDSFITGTHLSKESSRYYGSFRTLQREGLRQSTAAPTIFKPVKVKDVIYADGGMVASNPTSIAIHEAKTIFPNVPIELVVSVGTGGFAEKRFPPPEERPSSQNGWITIIDQLTSSATDAEQVHHVLEDIVPLCRNNMKYFRFNPIIGKYDDFPIDSKDPALLAKLKNITKNYLAEPEQQEKLEEIKNILLGKRRWWRRLTPW